MPKNVLSEPETRRMTLSEDANKAIAEEEAIVANISERLAAELKSSADKLSRESKRARQLTSELVAAQTDEEKQLLASDEAVSHAVSSLKAKDLKGLNKLAKTPYFARFVVREVDQRGKERDLEYRLGFTANPDCRIVDWRTAPISKLYYEYKEGEEYSEEIQGKEREGSIILRNSVEIKNGVLRKLQCRLGQFVKEQDTWEQLGGEMRSRAIGSASYGELPQILPLITAEQFDLITTESDTAVLIQGIAGSGKTTVALHRLAWLLHADNSEIEARDALVLVLHRALQVYTERTLPAMGVSGVRVVTFEDWANDTLKQILPAAFVNPNAQVVYRPANKPPHAVGRVYRSVALLKVLEQNEKVALQSLCERIEKNTNWEEIPNGIHSLFTSARRTSASSFTLIQALVNGCKRGLKNMQASHPLYAGLNSFAQFLEGEEANHGYVETIQTLLTQTDAILAADESHLLNSSLIQNAKKRFDECVAEESIDYYSDALLLRLSQLRLGGMLRQDGSLQNYQHIVADEVQEFSSTELACVFAAVPKVKDVTLVGDAAQQTREDHSFPGWKHLMSYWGLNTQESRYLSLTVSHRSTLAIMKLADAIQKRQTVTEGRDGRKPIWFASRSESKAFVAARKWLQQALERYPNAVTAVLCPNAKEAKQTFSLLQPSFGAAIRLGDAHSFSFEEGIIVTSIAQVKGLEFLNVLIWNPSDHIYPNKKPAQNALYVAVTRAEENLCIVTWKRPSPLLPNLFSPLVRGIDLDIEDDEREQQSA